MSFAVGRPPTKNRAAGIRVRLTRLITGEAFYPHLPATRRWRTFIDDLARIIPETKLRKVAVQVLAGAEFRRM